MPAYRDQGIVLRTIKLGEADRIVTILTASHGKIRAVARGVRRTKSRFGSRLEPFMRDDLLIAQGRRELDTVSQAVVISAYAPEIISDYDTYLSANVIVETADKAVSDLRETSISHTMQYRLLAGALASLAARKHKPEFIEASYVLRALSLAGWTPRLDACVVCGRQTDLRYFSVESGGVMCPTDRIPKARKISRDALDQLKALAAGNWKALEGPSAEGPAEHGQYVHDVSSVRHSHGNRDNDACGESSPPDAQVRSIVEEWSQYYLERPIRSMRLIHS